MARSALERASAGAPAASAAERHFFPPSERFGTSPLSTTNGFLSTATHPRVFAADVSGDGASDLIGVSPGSGAVPDGDVVWRMGAPVQVPAATELTRGALEGGGVVDYTLELSRPLGAAPPAGALHVRQNGALVTPSNVSAAGRYASWSLPFAPSGGADVNVDVTLSTGLVDRFGNRLDADGDGLVGGRFERRAAGAPRSGPGTRAPT